MTPRSKARRCKECPPGSRRPAPYAGPRCATHRRQALVSRGEASWERHILKMYGLTAAEYWQVYEAQGGRCSGCQRARGLSRRLPVDHSHVTRELRSLCCAACNQYLGYVRDDPEALRRLATELENPTIRRILGPRYAPERGSA